jgi:dephospho-CoA kinase
VARRPPFVGLTGGIGAGKSTVLAVFGELGAATASSDDHVRALYEEPEVVAAVAERFGPRVFVEGRVDRGAVADVVFTDAPQRRWLEGLLHPLVARRTAQWREAQERREPPPPLMVHEIPLLFEAGIDRIPNWLDAIVVVVAPPDLRATRAAARGAGHRHLAGRQAAQLSDDEKAARADIVIENAGSLDDLRARVGEAYEALLAGPPAA